MQHMIAMIPIPQPRLINEKHDMHGDDDDHVMKMSKFSWDGSACMHAVQIMLDQLIMEIN